MVVACAGDLISQQVIEQREEGFNAERNAIVGGYGFTETIIEGHFWFGLLDRLFGNKMTFSVSMLKMTVDQLFFSPLEVSSFMVWTHVIERQKDSTLAEKLNRDLLPTLSASYLFWCPASLASFYLVPYHLRALYTCIMCVVWDTFMSFASHNIVRARVNLGET